MDVAATLINYLDEATDTEWYHNVPKNAPAEFGTLTRSGGQTEIVRDLPRVTLIVYAATRGRASTLAQQAERALLFAQYEVAEIFGCEILSDYYDPLDGKHRHRVTASLIFND